LNILLFARAKDTSWPRATDPAQPSVRPSIHRLGHVYWHFCGQKWWGKVGSRLKASVVSRTTTLWLWFNGGINIFGQIMTELGPPSRR